MCAVVDLAVSYALVAAVVKDLLEVMVDIVVVSPAVAEMLAVVQAFVVVVCSDTRPLCHQLSVAHKGHWNPCHS